MITYGAFGGKLGWFRKLKRQLRYAAKNYQAINIIRNNISVEDIDIIHTNSTRSDVGFWLSMLTGKPHVVHIREFGDLDYQCCPLNPFYISYYNKYAERFICVSDVVKDHWVHKGIRADKMEVIYNGIPYEQITPSAYMPENVPMLKLVMSGTVQPTKGQHLAVKAIGSLPVEIKSHITLDLIGWDFDESYKRKLNLLSEEYGLVNPVKFWGAREDVLQMLGDYHIGLMCSRSEGFGRVTAEFMFAQLGVIASNSGANPELIEDGVSGLLFNAGDYKSLSEKILLYYNHRGMLALHARNAREKALRCYKAEDNAVKTFQVYKELINV